MILRLFEIFENKKVFNKLQFYQSVKIYHMFHLNLLYKAFINLLINYVNKLSLQVIINNKKK